MFRAVGRSENLRAGGMQKFKIFRGAGFTFIHTEIKGGGGNCPPEPCFQWP